MKQVGKLASCYKVFPSGWRDMFHIVTEDPECGDYSHTHFFGAKERIKVMFPFVKEEDFKKEE